MSTNKRLKGWTRSFGLKSAEDFWSSKCWAKEVERVQDELKRNHDRTNMRRTVSRHWNGNTTKTSLKIGALSCNTDTETRRHECTPHTNTSTANTGTHTDTHVHWYTRTHSQWQGHWGLQTDVDTKRQRQKRNPRPRSWEGQWIIRRDWARSLEVKKLFP